MGDAINEDTRPRAPVVRALANPALTSKTSLNSPAPIHRRNSLVDPERSALVVPKPRARSRMPTVRIINVIEEPEGMLLSQRKNRVGDPPNASPAQSRTPPRTMIAARSRLLLIIGVPTLTSGNPTSNETRCQDSRTRVGSRLPDQQAALPFGIEAFDVHRSKPSRNADRRSTMGA
jgi:hypothetical protein